MTLNLFNRIENRLLREMRRFDPDYDRFSSFLSYNHRETETKHLYEFDIPGMKKEEIKISVDRSKNLLEISGERKNSYEDEKYHTKQISYGNFYQALTLSSNTDMNSVKAELANGVLCVSFNKQKESTPQLMDVKID